MKYFARTALTAFLGALLIGSCKKEKEKPLEEPPLPKITIVKAADDNSDWKITFNAAAADRPDVWIDLNNNGTKDNGEAVTRFGSDMASQSTFTLGTSRTVVIYGKVTRLDCHLNELTAVDVSKNTMLQELDCGSNRLTALNLSQNTMLEYLDCIHNELTSLDLTSNSALTYLSCMKNKLTALDLTKNKALTSADLLGNMLTSIDLSQNKALERLFSYGNQLTSLNLSQNTAIIEVDITRNKITGGNMQQLLASLPARTAANKGELYLLYPPGENNSRPVAADVATARSKNWVLYEFKDARWKEML